jgi:hypothetical protein
MRKIKNWAKFNEKPFRIVDDVIKKGDYFIFNDDGHIRKCTQVDSYPPNPERERINFSYLKSSCKKIVFDDSAQMEFLEEKSPTIKTTPPNLKKGDKTYILVGYDLQVGTIESIGPKQVKIKTKFFGPEYVTSVPFDKVAEPDESIAVVWETWKGLNGRGGYRLERELYPEYRRPAKNWPFQSNVCEDHYGELSKYQPLDYTDGKKTY